MICRTWNSKWRKITIFLDILIKRNEKLGANDTMDSFYVILTYCYIYLNFHLQYRFRFSIGNVWGNFSVVFGDTVGCKLYDTIIFSTDEAALLPSIKHSIFYHYMGDIGFRPLLAARKEQTLQLCAAWVQLGTSVSQIILKWLHFKQEPFEGASPGTKFSCTDSGWIHPKYPCNGERIS